MRRHFNWLIAIGALLIANYLFNPALAENPQTLESDAKTLRSADIKSTEIKPEPRIPAGEWSKDGRDINLGTVFLSEGFEGSFPPAGWSIDSTHTGVETWHQYDVSPYEGSYYASCQYDPESVPQSEFIRTPVLDLSSNDANVGLGFSWLLSYGWLGNYNVFILVSTDGGSNFTDTVWNAYTDTPDPFENFVWYRDTLSLDAYRTTNVVIAFWYEGVDGAQAGIDMVEIFEWVHEDFEISVPPENWDTLATHTGYETWHQYNATPYTGSYYAAVVYDPLLVAQDEWLLSPVLDLSGKDPNVCVAFSWYMSYYWSVDPYDNYDLELWISTNGGSSFPDKLWSEEDMGVFTNFTWYRDTIVLNDYLVSNVVLAWRYVGTDGAEACLDLVKIIDIEPPANDDWANAIDLGGTFPVETDGTTIWATTDCPGVLDMDAVWYKFDLPYDSNLVKVNYCGTVPKPAYNGTNLFLETVVCGSYIQADGWPSIPVMGCPEGGTVYDLQWSLGPGTTAYIPIFTGWGDDQQDFHITVDVENLAPPHVVSILPINNARNVSINPTITATFDIDMDEATIDNTTFVAYSKFYGMIQAIVSYNAPSKTASLWPIISLMPGDVVRVTLTDAVESSGGIPLDSAYQWSFTVFEGTGPGNFVDDTMFTTGTSPWSVCAADIDYTGTIDLIVTDYGSSTDNILIFPGNGSGGFTPALTVSSGYWLADVIAVELNGDQLTDLVATDPETGYFSVLLNLNEYNFDVNPYYTVPGYEYVMAGDLDKDGDNDLVAFRSTNTLVYINDGTGSLSAGNSYTVGGAQKLGAVVDLDNDGDLDIATTMDGAYFVSILWNNGDASFVKDSTYPNSSQNGYLCTADFNNDGWIDIATVQQTGRTISVLFNDQDGTFTLNNTYSPGSKFSELSDIMAGNVNVDIWADIIVTHGTDTDVDSVFVLLNTGVGTFSPATGFGISGDYINDACLADLDGDDDLDIVTANYNSGNLTFLRNDPDDDPSYGTVADLEGNVYQTVTIGTQVWMAENLKATLYRNGEAVTRVLFDGAWENQTAGAYCYYDSDTSNANIYGLLYNWLAVDDSRNIAPEGWHVPTDDDWKEMEMYLGLSPAEADQIGWRGDHGGKLKEAGTSHWNSPNTGATNEAGFTALPSGRRLTSGTYDNIGNATWFMTSTEYDVDNAWTRSLSYDLSMVNRSYSLKKYGLPIRCVRDDISVPEISSTTVSDITETSALCGGNIVSNCGSPVTARGVCWSDDPIPTIADETTFDGTGTGSYVSTLVGLTPNTTYYVRAYALNSIGTAYGAIYSFKTSFTGSGTVTDIDGNEYLTVIIGDQEWMVENLKVTHYRNGDPIDNVTDNTAWFNLSTGAYCYFDNDTINANIYGHLYNWFAVSDSRNIAPEGWHVPTDDDWKELEMYLGLSQAEADTTGCRGDVGGKLKDAGTTHWESPNTGATNETGFTALPAGHRSQSGTFTMIGTGARFMTSTEYDIDFEWQRSMITTNSCITRFALWKKDGLSVRCVKDDIPSSWHVTNLNDDGDGSFRKAITDANTNPGPDTIVFDIDGTIALTTALPTLTDDGTVILGSSAPGGIHSVILYATDIPTGSGLTINSSTNVIEGIEITGAPDNGITVMSGANVQNTVSLNLIYDNVGLAIDLGADGVTANDDGDIDTGPNNLLNFPEIDSVMSQADQSYMIYGRAEANALIEFFVAHPAGEETQPADPSGYGEAWSYLGETVASPAGEFSFHDQSSVHFTVLTCMATDDLGNTSEMSANFALLPQPLIIVAQTYDPAKGGNKLQNGINVIVEDPNGDQFGMDANGDLIDEIPGEQGYFITENEDDSVVIPEPIVGDYIINFIGEVAGSTGSLYAGIIKIDGSLECVLIVDGDIPGTGQMDSYGYTYNEEEAIYNNGDANGDWECNVGDAVFIINYVFKGGPAPVPVLSGDANCDGETNVGDAVYIINYVFKGGDPPCYIPN